MVNTKITKFDVDWLRIKSACMTTVSKQAGKEPNDEWKKKILICRHSPIRRGTVSWKWESIPYCTSVHFCRHHEGNEKFVSTSREDRTGIERSQRSQTDPVTMEMDANLQALMSISERRLCMCADPTTREYWQSVIREVNKYDEIVAWSNAPQCVRCGGCVEPFSSCSFYSHLMKGRTLEEQNDVMKRYDIYRQYAWENYL